MKFDPATQHNHKDPEHHICLSPEWLLQPQMSVTLQLKYSHPLECSVSLDLHAWGTECDVQAHPFEPSTGSGMFLVSRWMVSPGCSVQGLMSHQWPDHEGHMPTPPQWRQRV